MINMFGKNWLQHDKVHRTDRDAQGRVLPAVVYLRRKSWCQHGKLHRADCNDLGQVLPASIYANGDKLWCSRGKYLNENCGA